MSRRERTRRLIDLGRLLEASGLEALFSPDDADGLFALLQNLAEALAAHQAESGPLGDEDGAPGQSFRPAKNLH